jgi:KDO2-lipid IV(A) lauroyltransferase
MGLTDRAVALLLRAGFRGLRALGPARASNLGGWVARTIGPWLPVSDVARRNLAMALPNMAPAERARIVRGVWDNLGRTAAELPHVAGLRLTASGPGLECEGLNHLPDSGPALLVSGHLGNWEALPAAGATLWRPVALLYRAASSAPVDAVLSAERRRASGAPGFAKGAAGARAALAWLRQGGALGMLVDQKMNDGIEARFFGRPAMTAPAAAAFALRFGCPIVPARVVRLGPARLRILCEPPLSVPRTGDRLADIAAITQAINDRLEVWVRDHPEQWLWLHRRWPREVTAASSAAPPPAAWSPAPPHRHPGS